MKKLPKLLGAMAFAAALVIAGIGTTTVSRADDAGLDKKTVEKMIDAKIKSMRKSTLDPDTIGPIVRDYLIENPEILEEVLAALEAKRDRDQAMARADALENNREAIFRDPHSPVVGNPAGDITLVEFFDYNCGYCKRMLPAIVDLVKTDPKLRVVFKEWPVLSEGSADAARIALGVLKVAPEQYMDFHVELMAQPGGNEGIGEERALQVADELGIDTDAVLAASKEPSIDEAIAENFRVAEALGLRGTPSYVVGNEVIPGAVSFETLQEKIAEAREAECLTC